MKESNYPTILKTNEGKGLFQAVKDFDKIFKENINKTEIISNHKQFFFNLALSMANPNIGTIEEKISLYKLIYKHLNYDDNDEDIIFIKNLFYYNGLNEDNKDFDELMFSKNINLTFKKSGFVLTALNGDILKIDKYCKEVIFDNRLKENSNFFSYLSYTYSLYMNETIKSIGTEQFITGVINITLSDNAYNSITQQKPLERINNTKTINYKISRVIITNESNELSIGVLIEMQQACYYENLDFEVNE